MSRESSSVTQHPKNTSVQTIGISAVEQYSREIDLPCLDGVCTAIRKLHNNWAFEEDGTPAEIYKTCFDSLCTWLHPAFRNGRTSEAVPSNRSEAVFLPSQEGQVFELPIPIFDYRLNSWLYLVRLPRSSGLH